MPDRQPARDADTLADLLELRLLLGDVNEWSLADARGWLSTAGGASDASAELALNAIQRRERVLSPMAYPFHVDSIALRRDANAADFAYSALLLLADPSSPIRARPADFDRAIRLFDGMVVGAVGALLGSGSIAVRFAWPSDVGRPRDFPAAIRWLSTQMRIPLGTAYRPPQRQDGGVDIVAWRPFPDTRPGFSVLLVQCTLERDFVHKSRDIDLRIWAGWLAFDVDPLLALAIPYVVSSEEDWLEMARRGIVLDRLRLAGLLVAMQDDEVALWSKDQIDSQQRTSE